MRSLPMMAPPSHQIKQTLGRSHKKQNQIYEEWHHEWTADIHEETYAPD